MSLGYFLCISLLTYFLLRQTVKKWIEKKYIHAQKPKKLASLPKYYVWYGFLWAIIPLTIILIFQKANAFPFLTSIHSYLYIGIALFFSCIGFLMSCRALFYKKCVRGSVEKIIKLVMVFLTILTLFIILLILGVLLFESILFFSKVPFFSFFFGTNWMPNDLPESAQNFGALPLFLGTLFITIIALVITFPLGTLAAICLSEYASKRVMEVLRPTLETMAGVPTVVYGFFAAIVVAPLFQKMALAFGWSASAQSAMVAGVVLGVMLIPMLTSLYVDVLLSVPRALREASLGLGATKQETILKVVLPVAKPGLIGALLLTFSRAIGETMLVVMAAGLAANLTLNPFSSVTTVTVQIVSLLTGDQQFDSLQTLAAFALGLTLFFITLIINFLAERFNKKVMV